MFERRFRDMEWTLPSPKWIFVFNILLFLLRVSLAKTLATIHWDKNSNFGTGGLLIEAEINDVVEIECPKTFNTTSSRQYAQYLTFTQVSLEGFEQCSTNRSYGKKHDLLLCNRPFEDNSYLLLFLRDSPFPGGLTFAHSQTYYFITTSDGTQAGLSRTQGGLCATHHMKVKFYIKPLPTVAVPTGQTPARTNAQPRPTVRPTRPATRPTPQVPTKAITRPVTRLPDKITNEVLKETPKLQKPNSQSAENAGHALVATPLRATPLLLLAASLRWLLT